MAQRGLGSPLRCLVGGPSHGAFLLGILTGSVEAGNPGLGTKRWRQLNSRWPVMSPALSKVEGMVEWRSILGVILAYALITVVVTYPVAFGLRSALAGAPDQDALQHLWISWWTEKALLDLGTSPAQASYLYYPDGTYHPMLWVTPYPQVAALPLQLLFGQVVAYNLHLLLSFVLTGLTTYLLCYYLTRNRSASFIGGLIFAFFPNRLSHATVHLAQVVTYFFPLCALYLIRLFCRHNGGWGKGEGQPDWHNAWKCGILLALSMLVNIVHVAYFIIPFTALLILYHIAVGKVRLPGQRVRLTRSFLYIVMAFALAALLTAPFLLPFAWRSLSGQLSYLRMAGTVDYSADLLGFVTPALSHPVWGRWPSFRAWATAIIGRGNTLENTVYLGVLALLLAGWGIRRCWNHARFWFILGLVALMLSLGPVLKIGGLQTSLPLPYALLQHLPFYKWGRIPGRANETIALPLAVLASFGITSLLKPLRRLRKPSPGWLITVLSVLILLDYVVAWPFPAMDARVPDFYQRMAQESEDLAVLDLPQWPIWLREASNRAMHYQTVHQHKIVGGYVWRLPEGLEGGMKALQELVLPPVTEDMIQRPSPEEALQALNRYHIRYVVLHKGVWATEEDEEALAALRHLLGEPFYDDQRLAAFLVPEVEVGGDEDGLLALSYGWYQVEEADGHPARWLKDEGTLYVHRLTEGRYRLRFAAYPFRGPRHLQLTVNGQTVADFEVANWQELVTPPFALTKGQNDIAFQVAEGCEVPAEVEVGSNDRRCLSVLFQRMELLAADKDSG
jgi:hypothetical protein